MNSFLTNHHKNKEKISASGKTHTLVTLYVFHFIKKDPTQKTC